MPPQFEGGRAKGKVRGTAKNFSQKRRLKVNTMPLVSFALPP
ncbi:MAG: hypothetical protein EORIYHIE_001475, partial [Candidatus Fervidibacter sp.]